MSDKQKSELAAAVAAVMGEIKDLPKDGYNKEQSYHYTTESAITNAIRPLLAKHKLAILPTAIAIERDSYLTKSQNTMHRVFVTVTYTLAHADGESVALQGMACGADTGDKAVAKALTAAYKWMLLETFCLGRSGEDEQEGQQVEEAAQPARQSAPAPQRQATAPKEGGPVMRVGKTKGAPLASLNEHELQRALDWCVDQANPGPVVRTAMRELEGELQRRAVMPPVTHTVVGAPDDADIF